MTGHYGIDREWRAIRFCPGCGVDHPEMEFKREPDGSYHARCWKSQTTLELDPATGKVSAVEAHAD